MSWIKYLLGLCIIYGVLKLSDYLMDNIFRFLTWTRVIRADFSEIEKMTEVEFEAFVADLAAQLGCTKVETAGNLVLVFEGEDRLIRTNNHTKTIGADAVYEIIKDKNKNQNKAAMIIATGDFTEEAKKLADDNNVRLWDRLRLADRMIKVQKKRE